MARTCLRSRLEALRWATGGSSAVEFALIAPILIMMLMGLIQFALIFYTYNTAQQAGWLVARQVATGGITPASAADLTRSKLPVWAQTAAVIPPVTLSNGVYTVTVTITLANASPINFLASSMGAASLTTTAAFLSEAN